VVLFVNVASKCGFAKQYHELENLYSKYKDQGFEVIGVPCNQFNNQGKKKIIRCNKMNTISSCLIKKI
jgi:glutathione peroxidase-family protein